MENGVCWKLGVKAELGGNRPTQVYICAHKLLVLDELERRVVGISDDCQIAVAAHVFGNKGAQRRVWKRRDMAVGQQVGQLSNMR